MRNVGSQLTEYFEAATERLDAADVFAQADVRRQAAASQRRRRWRPSRAVAAGFAGALATIGGAFFAGWLLYEPTDGVTGPAGSAAESSGGLTWWPVAAVALTVLAAFGVIAVRRLRTVKKEIDMQTLDQKAHELTDTRVHRSARRSRLLIIALASVLVIGAVAIGWLVAENRDLRTDRAPLETATDLVDAWFAGWEAVDGAAVAALFTEDGMFADPEFGVIGPDAIADDVARRGPIVSNGQRNSDLAARVFRVPAQFDSEGETWVGEVEIEIEGDLISRFQWLDWDTEE